MEKKKAYLFDEKNTDITAKLSSFWLGKLGLNDLLEKNRVLKLAAIKRAISNFVYIIGKSSSVKTTFSSGEQSYSTKHKVVISGNGDKNLDSTCGIAMHEASHIRETDFEIIINLRRLIPNELYIAYAAKYNVKSSDAEYDVHDRIHKLLNIIEDRRIDVNTVTTYPGYAGYYVAMYDEYFYAPIINLALKSGSLRKENWVSYDFRITNLMNENTDLNALKGLKEIARIIDLEHINRLKDTQESLDVAIDVYRVMERYLEVPKTEQKEKSKSNEKSDDDTESNESGENDTENSEPNEDDNFDVADNDKKPESDETTDGNKDEEKSDEENEEPNDDGITSHCNEEADNDSNNGKADDLDDNDDTDESGDSKTKNDDNDVDEDENESGEGKIDSNDTDDEVDNNNHDIPELSKKQFEKLIEALEEQDEFVKGELNKTKVSEKELKQIESLDEAGSELVEVGDNNIGKVNVLVLHRLTQSVIDSGLFGIFSDYSAHTEYAQDNVIKGVSLGKLLGRKLQIRNDDNSLQYNRLLSGKIDKRMISSLSYENEKVFYTTVITTHKNIHCHITIDASSSMSGDKFNNCIISAVAIAQAASMTKNISVTIDFRFTMNADKTTIPVILIAYDSKKDKMHKITTLFRYLKAYGTTPEGLCFESISKIILNNNKNDKNFFINFSDGMPYFGNEFIRYQNDIAIEHTRKQVEKIKFAGIEVISYFIADEVSDSILNGFKKMYGDDATNINVTSIIPLTKSLNEKFLKI